MQLHAGFHVDCVPHRAEKHGSSVFENPWTGFGQHHSNKVLTVKTLENVWNFVRKKNHVRKCWEFCKKEKSR